MQNPVRFTRFWQSVAVVMMVALVVEVRATPGAAQSVQNVTAHHVLQVTDSDRDLNRICVGDRVTLTVRVALNTLEWNGSGDAGDVVVTSGQFTPTIADPSIITAEAGSLASAGTVPFSTQLTLVAVAPGTTTVTLNATLDGTVSIFLDEDVALPISFAQDNASPVTVTVRVKYCAYEITINSIWETSMHGAFTVLIANARNLRLTPSSFQENTFEFRSAPMTAPYLQWTFVNNRIRGCVVSGGRFDSQAPDVTAVVGESSISVAITYWRAVGGGPLGPWYSVLCLPYHGATPCPSRPDGQCFAIPPNHPVDFWDPHRLDMTFDLEGGTRNPRHGLTHSWGAATGWGIVNLTPVPVRPAPSP